MTTPRPTLFLPFSLVSLVVILAGIAWLREPEAAIAWAVAMLMLPIAWPLVERRYRGKELDATAREDLATIRYSIAGAALMLAIPLALTLMISFDITEPLGDEIEKRGMGIIFGIILLIYGNNAPKRPVSLSQSGCSPAKMQAHTRFAGRTFILTALIYALIWAFAPLDWALYAAMAVLITGVGAVLLRGLGLRSKT